MKSSENGIRSGFGEGQDPGNVFRLPGRNKQIAVKSLELALDLFLRDDPLDLID